MSDDLVKRARDCANGIGSFKSDKGDFGLLDDLADRIEALEAQHANDCEMIARLREVLSGRTLDETHESFWKEKVRQLKAALSKALGALGDIGDGEPEWPDDPQKELDWCRNRALTAYRQAREATT